MPATANGSESKFKNPFAGLQNAADHLRKSDTTPSMAGGDVATEAMPPYISNNRVYHRVTIAFGVP